MVILTADAAESRRMLRDGAERKETASGVGFVNTLKVIKETRAPRNRLRTCQSSRETLLQSNSGGTAEMIFVPDAICFRALFCSKGGFEDERKGTHSYQ